MLSQHDRRVVQEIERQLRLEAPDLAHRLSSFSPPPGPRWALGAAIGIVVLGTLGVLLGLLTANPLLVVPAVPFAVGGWVWLIRRDARAASLHDARILP